MSLKQPISQVRFTNVAVVRLRHGGERFEVACYKNKVLNWREGKETDLNEVLQAHAVFHNVSRGELVRKDELLKHFGTDDELLCIHTILEKGELQVSELERRQHLENLFNDVVSLVVDLTYSAVTQLPLSRSSVSSALKALGFAVRLQQPAKAQALHAALLLQQHNPQQIRRRLMRFKLQLPLAAPAAAAAASDKTPVAAAAALLHFITKDCAGLTEHQEPTLELLQQQQQQQQQDAEAAAAAAATATPASEWLVVFLASPGVYRELEEKAHAAGASLSVVAWNCLHDMQQLQQQQEQQQQQQQQREQQQQRKRQPQREGAAEEEGDLSSASKAEGPPSASSPASAEASSSRSSSSSSSSSDGACCCCSEQCFEDEWTDTRTRAQRKGRSGKQKKEQRSPTAAAATAAAGAAVSPAALTGVPCALHASTCKHQPRKTEKASSISPKQQQQRRKKQQQQQKLPRQQQKQQLFENSLTEDALDWLERDVKQLRLDEQRHPPVASAAAAAADTPRDPQQQQQQQEQHQQQQHGVRCRVCDEPLKDVAALRAHCKGSRHAANLQRQANKEPPLCQEQWEEIQLDRQLLGPQQTQVVRGF